RAHHGRVVSQSVSAAPPHSRVDDAAGLLTGVLLASLGLALLRASGAVTGVTAGASLALTHVLPVGFGAVFVAVTVPFMLLAVRRKGWAFTLRSVLAVALVSALSQLDPQLLAVTHVAPLYGVVVGNLALGLALLVLFRHRSSLGGFNVVALVAQERRGWRAGYVQLGLDAAVVAASALVAPLGTVLYSAVGAVVLNLVLAMNHRPGRYLGG
ncbi:MAG TPA: YitT family protein, partial [Angustibacter sp.]|nr:YitT family protein [Angustibacter sp.]